MQYYGIVGKELEFFKSYLSNRSQYVELDTKKSDIYQLPPCSVVQGSKLSTTLYTIYTNEVPALKELMTDAETLRELTGLSKNINTEIEHNTYNFVDDSNNSIVFDNPEEIQDYIKTYMTVLKEYYSIQKLLINEEKTLLFVTSQPKHLERYRTL